MKHYKELKEGIQDANILKVIFLAGGPGSGKSYVVGQSTTPFQGLRIINTDTEFNKILKYETTHIRGGKDASPLFGKDPKSPETIAHSFAQMKRRTVVRPKTAAKKRGAESGRLGMIIDSTGAKIKKVEEQVKGLQQLGYDCFMIFVDTTLEVALERNRERARGGKDRQVPENIVKKDWNAVQRNRVKLKSIIGNRNYIEVQNNDAGENVFKKLSQHIKIFLQRKVQNEIGKQWIRGEIERRDIKKYTPVKPEDVSKAPGAHRHLKIGGEKDVSTKPEKQPAGIRGVGYQTKGRYIQKHKKLMQKLARHG
jgi:predicted kinase